MWGTEWGWWGMGMMLVMSAFWVFVILAAVWLVQALTRRSETSPADRSALRILEDRLARGEIDVEEFRAKKLAIEGGR